MTDSYPFTKHLSDLIKELGEMKTKHGDIWVEGFAEGCFCGCEVTFSEAEPERKRGDYVYEPRRDAVVLIGERY
jgi:hypothetical protein